MLRDMLFNCLEEAGRYPLTHPLKAASSRRTPNNAWSPFAEIPSEVICAERDPIADVVTHAGLSQGVFLAVESVRSSGHERPALPPGTIWTALFGMARQATLDHDAGPIKAALTSNRGLGFRPGYGFENQAIPSPATGG